MKKDEKNVPQICSDFLTDVSYWIAVNTAGLLYFYSVCPLQVTHHSFGFCVSVNIPVFLNLGLFITGAGLCKPHRFTLALNPVM